MSRDEVFQDWGVNRGRRKSQVILAMYRGASLCQRGEGLPGPLGKIYVGVYKILTNWVMGVEIPPETTIA